MHVGGDSRSGKGQGPAAGTGLPALMKPQNLSSRGLPGQSIKRLIGFMQVGTALVMRGKVHRLAAWGHGKDLSRRAPLRQCCLRGFLGCMQVGTASVAGDKDHRLALGCLHACVWKFFLRDQSDEPLCRITVC